MRTKGVLSDLWLEGRWLFKTSVFHNHRWSPIAATVTSMISSHVLRTADNSVLMQVHLHAYTLAVAPASTFPATPTSVAFNALLSSRRRLLAKRLAWSIAFFFHGVCKLCNVSNVLVTPLLKGRFSETLFSKFPVINGPGKLYPFTLKIEVSIVLHLAW